METCPECGGKLRVIACIEVPQLVASIEHYGYNCSVCGFSYEQVYGHIGADYIEVHHLRRVADAGEECLIDPIKDLQPVCANCHRMPHKRRPPLSVEELLTHNPAPQRTPASRRR
ncbi:MAG: hypothetical protein EXR85_03740 [Xanthomonadales bacterium]|nr:hypothetical protein [Xanthomonadales bacterium]